MQKSCSTVSFDTRQCNAIKQANFSRAKFLDSAEEAPAYLIDLMHDKNPEIRKVCDNTLDIISVS